MHFSILQVILVTFFCFLSSSSIAILKIWSTELHISFWFVWLISHASSHYPLLYTATDNVITFCWSTVFRIHVKLHLSSVNVLYLGYSTNSSNYELCSSVHKFSFCKIAFILLEAVQCRSLFSSIFPLIFSSVDFNL